MAIADSTDIFFLTNVTLPYHKQGSLSAIQANLNLLIGTFRSEDEDDNEYEFSVLSTRTSKNVSLQTLCACSVRKTRTGTPSSDLTVPNVIRRFHLPFVLQYTVPIERFKKLA